MNEKNRDKERFGKNPTQHTLSHGYPTDVVLGYCNNHKNGPE